MMKKNQLQIEIREGIDTIERTITRSTEIQDLADQINGATDVYFIGCGTSYWTGVMSSYLFRSIGLDTRSVPASEFLYSAYPISKNTVVIGLSQSGETTETIAAVEKAMKRGAESLAITNTPGSSLEELVDYSYVTLAGPECSMLATKSVDAMMITAYLIVDHISDGACVIDEDIVPDCRDTIDQDLSAAISLLETVENAYTLGTGVAYGLAGEAATKLGEGPLIHATPLPTFEILHGPIANVVDTAVLLIATHPGGKDFYSKIIGDLNEAGACTIVFQSTGDTYGADVSMMLPEQSETILPALKLIQQLAHDVTFKRGFNPDDVPGLSKYTEWRNLR